MTAGVQDMPRELSKRKENAQVNNNPRPKPSRQLTVQPKQKKSAPPPNVPRLEVRTTQGVVYLTRAEGEAGRPHLNYARLCIAYTCECGGLIYIPVHYLSGDTDEKERAHGVARCIVDHKRHSRHKNAMKSQEATFAESLSRAAESEEPAPVERRRALVSHRREAPPGSAQAPFSELGSGKRSTCPDIAPRTEASRSFGNSGVLGGGALGALGATPAALLVPASLLTDPNFTLKLPGGNLSLPNAGQDADVDTLKGFMLLAYIGQGTSALLALLFKRGERDELAELDKLIQTASARGQSILS